MPHAYIGLGSNLENPVEQVKRAFNEIALVEKSQLIASSALYLSRAWGVESQPDFINAVALIETDLTPLELLDKLQAIENAHNRLRSEHWGPRTLDLDLLLIDNQFINSERLTVPHSFLKERKFVLYPLADINPELILPCGTPLPELIANCSRDGLTRLG